MQEQLKFEGETGPYVQYAHARAESVLKKAHQPLPTKITQLTMTDDAWTIIKMLQNFPATVRRANHEFEPSMIAKYALRLAKAFNKYYAHTKILTDDDQLNDRLALVQAVSLVLKEALRLLGVQAPDEM